MKILILDSYADAFLTFRKALIQEMLTKNHDVIACAPDASTELQNTLLSMGMQYQHVTIERTGLNPIKDIQSILNLRAVFKKMKPDMVLGYTIKPVIYGSIAGKFARVPSNYAMITGLGYAFTGKNLKSRGVNTIVRALYRLSMKYNHKIFFHNPDDLKYFESLKIITEKQGVGVNGSGVNIRSFTPVPFPETISFLLIARLIKDKGIQEYAEAARRLKQKYPHVTFRLVGWIDNANPASVSENELDLWVAKGIIEYLGKLSDVRPAIAASSVYVLPSYYREGTPLSILEALAMGRPVITTDASGCRETVQHGQNGVLVPVKDVPALAAAMEHFIRHPELIEPMGQRSRQIAVDKYDVRKVNAVILKTMGLD
ncbi:glycosyltransferase family 4 protein [Desulfococcaceae bacterium HSG7]|nr:glycosyltransferase family 4 protein [Desulfococcaceae bacterium HSG7]